ncbi:HNH endonuclease [Candidatus Pacearchaeota archaeon]|nr:HNH endonuclease [Candidatus Pacearchaeota archaeon]
MKKLTQKRLKELLHYDPKTGVFIWKKSTSNRVKIDSVAGSVSNDGYRLIKVDGKRYVASRLAWLIMEGYLPEHDMDHKNRIRNDDRWCNLRHASRQCNLRNAGISKNNKSGIVGVSWSKKYGVWVAQICINRKRVFLGQYVSKVDAIRKRWEAEKKYNFPNCNTSSTAYQYLLGKGLVNV